jgi:DNA-binding FadR family transcriptional regulator
VQLRRAADVVADRIRELIVTGELGDGERLPRLDLLLDEFGISGPSMREALRILESEGLITVQRGSIGGAVVHRPSHRNAAYALALVLRSRSTEVADVANALAFLEQTCVRLCARRPDRKRKVVPQLRKMNHAAHELIDADELEFTEAMTAFHEEVMRQCGSDTLALVTRAIGAIWLVDVNEWATGHRARGTFADRAQRLGWVEFQARLVDLIAAGDEDEAVAVMAEHFNPIALLENGLDPHQVVDASSVRATSH